MKIKSISLQNFKGCKSADYQFDGKNATISGANGSGKTTIFDALTWILFGRDSLDNAKFEVRPLDENGKQIHEIEISVTAVFDIDGKEVELKKSQKENWVKKRGSEFPTFQGNVNSFEVDGYPKAEKDFKEYINSIVNDDLFKMLTNPTYFPNMPWKEQRNILINLVPGFDDVEFAESNEKFASLLDEIEKAPSLDDIKAKYTKSINALKKQQIEIPVRIDEVSNSKVDIDVAELELLKNSLNEQIAEVKVKISDTDKQFAEYQALTDGIMELKFAQSDMIRKANEENINKRREIESKIADKKFLVKQTEKSIADCEKRIEDGNINHNNIQSRIDGFRERYMKTKNLVFDENSLVCSYCGQEYPADKKEQIKAEFESKKAKEIEDIANLGNKEKAELDKIKASNEQLEKELPEHKKSLEMLNNAIADLEKELSVIPEKVDISLNKEYLALEKQIADKEKALSQMNNADEVRKALNYELECSQNQLIECEKKIALSSKNIEIDERIEELQTELKSVGIKIAEQEKMLYLLDEFIKFKLDKISDGINSMFDGVCFKLFDTQINGGIKEVCECTVNGVPYGSLNNGHRLVAGLQIIKALQTMYKAYMPIFVDNAESLNDFNIPDMDCQLIKLKVSEDKDLRIEVE